MTRRLSVLIPSRSVANLVVCLDALLPAVPCTEVVVIDDGLHGRPYKDRVKYVDGIRPFCFARNVNLGALATQAENDLLIMNDDAIVHSGDTPTDLHDMLCLHDNYGVISAGIQGAACNPALLVQPGAKPPAILTLAAPMVPFICVCIRRTLWDEIGGLDERFTDYGFEDDDFCRSVRKAGYKLGALRSVRVEHGTLPSSFRSFGYVSLEPNRARFVAKWGNHEGCDV